MKRFLFLLVVVAMGCLAAGAVMAADQPNTATPNTALSSAQPTLDPFLGGPIQSKVPMVPNCIENGFCALHAPGDSCAPPAGCTCGYSSGHIKCGRFGPN